MTDTVGITACDSTCTVTFVLAPAPVSDERIADLNVMFGLFILAAVIVYFGRRLLRIFEVNPHED